MEGMVPVPIFVSNYTMLRIRITFVCYISCPAFSTLVLAPNLHGIFHVTKLPIPSGYLIKRYLFITSTGCTVAH
jgi:hypothetical protein